MTDMQTILRSFDSAHVAELTRRSRAIVKQELRQNAIAIRKIQQYDEMQRKGITVESFEKIRKKADDYDKIHGMNDEEKESIRRALSKNPKNSLANSEWMLRAVKSVREITNNTKAEIYEVAAEPGVNYIKRLGLDMVEGVADDVDKVAATTACLFFGFLDGATTISESYGGGGGNNELPKKKDNEDDLSFARRCHQMAKAMHAPRYRLRRG